MYVCAYVLHMYVCMCVCNVSVYVLHMHVDVHTCAVQSISFFTYCLPMCVYACKCAYLCGGSTQVFLRITHSAICLHGCAYSTFLHVSSLSSYLHICMYMCISAQRRYIIYTCICTYIRDAGILYINACAHTCAAPHMPSFIQHILVYVFAWTCVQ